MIIDAYPALATDVLRLYRAIAMVKGTEHVPLCLPTSWLASPTNPRAFTRADIYHIWTKLELQGIPKDRQPVDCHRAWEWMRRNKWIVSSGLGSCVYILKYVPELYSNQC